MSGTVAGPWPAETPAARIVTTRLWTVQIKRADGQVHAQLWFHGPECQVDAYEQAATLIPAGYRLHAFKPAAPPVDHLELPTTEQGAA